MTILKPLYTVEKLDDDNNPFSARFRYVEGYNRKYLWGTIGPAVSEIWVETTYEQLAREMQVERINNVVRSHSIIPAFYDAATTSALMSVARTMAKDLDFTGCEALRHWDDEYGLG